MQRWQGLTRPQKARYISHAIVGAVVFAAGAKWKGPGAGVAGAVIGVAAHEALDLPVALVLLNFGLI